MAKKKLRKMLGSAEHPVILEMMPVIDTQSKATLAAWALDYAKNNFLPIYEKDFQDGHLRTVVEAVEECLSGKTSWKETKPVVKEAQALAKDAEGHPAAQAAARAVATACGVMQTPSNSLGFTFYGAAAIAYDREGLEAEEEVYDAVADEEFLKMLESLKAAAVEDEPKPVKIKWYC